MVVMGMGMHVCCSLVVVVLRGLFLYLIEMPVASLIKDKAGVYILVIGVILGPWPKSQLKNKNKNIQGGGNFGPGKSVFFGPLCQKRVFFGPQRDKKRIFGPQRAKMTPSMSMSPKYDTPLGPWSPKMTPLYVLVT